MWSAGALQVVVLLSLSIGVSHQRPASDVVLEGQDITGDVSWPEIPTGQEGRGGGSSVKEVGGRRPSSSAAEAQRSALPADGDRIVFPAELPSPNRGEKSAESVTLDTRYLISVPKADCPPDTKEGHGKDCREPE